MRWKIFLTILGTSTFAFGEKLKFGWHCYSLPNTPIMAHEINSQGCGPLDPELLPKGADGKAIPIQATPVGADGEKDICCVMQAGCAPVSAEAAESNPPNLWPLVLNGMMYNGDLKASVLICKGTAVVKGSVYTNVKCPQPSKCRGEVFYNTGGMPVGFTPNEPEAVAIPAQKEAVTK